MPSSIDIAGQRYGRLIAVERMPPTRSGQTRWRCRCDCGNEITVQLGNLRGGKSRSCKCLTKELSRAMFTKHGEAHRTPEYQTWKGMKARCHNPNSPYWKHYGARGIAVCDRWRHDFPAFLADMGRRPSGLHSIDRVNNDLGYSKANCRWAVAVTQANNTTRSHVLTHDGKSMTIAEWERSLGFRRGMLSARVQKGWSDAEALTTPIDPRGRRRK